MLKLSGTLAIRTIHGARGAFNVGRLLTEIGEFAVKDSLIEEYDEGRYKGEFGIIAITPSTYFAAGRTVVEVRARLGSIALEDIAAPAGDDRSPIIEPDPIESEPASTGQVSIDTGTAESATATFDTAVATAGSDSLDTPDDAEHALQTLFGSLWPLEVRVKLDPTVDRGLFRTQRDKLKELGYRFQPVGQVWERAETS
ncbi:DUF3275 family protein [Algiphilus sp. W345]|uniref:DUF3275 family protein n=1 Tax=Banduia mediterranea TaxID=3075609 RepID=A0ABU2WLV5_9GAMM|nr:DUF3275 family protein [Algiphilus sp. W345]MDT0498599.1 DUF3275 family protein [Algiphilus sp. W345]